MSDSAYPNLIIQGMHVPVAGMPYSVFFRVSEGGALSVTISDPLDQPTYLWSFAYTDSRPTAGVGNEIFLATASIPYTTDYTPGVPVMHAARTNAGNPTTDADVVVGVAAANVVAANLARRSLTLQNNGTVDIFLNWTGAAALDTKFKLVAGGSVSWSGENCPNTALSAIASLAAQRLYVLET